MPAVATAKTVSSTVTDSTIEHALLPGIKSGLLGLGDRATAELIEMLSVPVEFDGNKVIRSAPGEPPRREDGDLIATVDSNLVPGPDVLPALRVSIGGHAEELEYGAFTNFGQVEPRPHMAPLRESMKTYAADELGDGIRRTT
jgi:hypothetical protein